MILHRVRPGHQSQTSRHKTEKRSDPLLAKMYCHLLRVYNPTSLLCNALTRRANLSQYNAVPFHPRFAADVYSGAENEPASIGHLYTPAQPITAVTAPSKSLLIMAVSEEGYVWQWDMPLQVCKQSTSVLQWHELH